MKDIYGIKPPTTGGQSAFPKSVVNASNVVYI